MTTTQHAPAAAIEANTARLYVCALMWATPAVVRDFADLLTPADFDHPLDEILEAVHTCARRGHTGPAAVMNELLRAGTYRGPVRREMETLPMAGGVPVGLHEYALGHLAARYREHVAAHGTRLAELADTAPEADLWPAIEYMGRALKHEVQRLDALRGGAE